MFITKGTAIAAMVAQLPHQLLQADITQKLSPIKLQVDTLVPEEIVDTVQSFGKVGLASREAMLAVPPSEGASNPAANE